jgi:hypothetical protein
LSTARGGDEFHLDGIGMGIALGALCLRLSTFLDGAGSSTDGAPAASVPAHFSTTNFRWAFSAAAVVVLVSMIGYVKLPRSAGDAVRGVK